MADELKGSVIGQDEAIQKVVKSIQRNRAVLKIRTNLLEHSSSWVPPE